MFQGGTENRQEPMVFLKYFLSNARLEETDTHRKKRPSNVLSTCPSSFSNSGWMTSMYYFRSEDVSSTPDTLFEINM